MSSNSKPHIVRARRKFNESGGVMRMNQAVKSGISRTTLYKMYHDGEIIRMSRGVYRLADLEPLGNPDLVTVATRIPKGVICLVSALAFHDLTTQIPHKVDIALLTGSEKPRIDYPPVNVVWFSSKAFESGVKTHTIDGVSVRIYNPEKTIADCFKFRNKIGFDIAMEGLRRWKEQRKASVEKLLEQARIDRVEKIMRPYIEALL